MALILKNCRYIVTQNKQRDILEHDDIRIEENIIAGISSQSVTAEDKVIDCSQHIVMPGLANMHTHLGMTFLRGSGEDMELMQWLEKKILPAERRLKDHDVYRWTYHGAVEALKSGTTTVCDFYFFPFSMAKAIEDVGLRAWVGSDVQDKKTPHADSVDAALWLSEQFIDAYKKHLLITPIAYAHSPYACSEKTLHNVKKLAEKYTVRFAMHLAETRYEVDYCKQKYGVFPVQAVANLGLCDDNTIFAHCTWITKDEIKMLGGAVVVHNPISNMKLASGSTLPIPELIAASVCVGLGTDSAASNNNLDMFEEMKVAGLLQKFHRWDTSALPVQQILDMATCNAGVALKKPFGVLAAGYLADVIVLDLSEHLLPIDKERVINHLVYSAKGSDVCTVIVDGSVRYHDSKFIPQLAGTEGIVRL